MTIVSSVKLFPTTLSCLKVGTIHDPLHACKRVSLSWLSLCCFIFCCILILNGPPHMKRLVSAVCLRWWGWPPRPTSLHTRRCWSWCPRFPRMKTAHRSLTSDTDCRNVILQWWFFFSSISVGWWTNQTLGSWTFPLISELRQIDKWNVYKVLLPFAKAFFSLFLSDFMQRVVLVSSGRGQPGASCKDACCARHMD